jgi:hypothetical protein
MRRLLLALFACCVLGSSGCFLNAYSPDPGRRMWQLMNQSEDLRQIARELEHFWMIDQPSHLTDERVHGGVAPN